ncbi:MAG: hypothetical protein RIQ81_1764 [Pseudomonadota bacterium]
MKSTGDFFVSVRSHPIAVFAGDIKIAHSIFALPFAIVGVILSGAGLPTPETVSLLLVAMVSARSFAMGANRLLDADVDAMNPRTRMRAVPSGRLDLRSGWIITVAAAAVFIAAAFALSPLCGGLSFPLLLILAFYSHMKRLSWLTHWYLGLCLGLAPVAASIALTGGVTLPAVLVAIAVTMWTAGFDILYSLQDRSFDEENGLHSVPARFGVRRSLWISRIAFGAMIALLLAAGILSGAGLPWYAGVAGVAALLCWEHWILRDSAGTVDGKIIDKAFFTANAWVSVVFCAAAVLDRVIAQ